jgi:hypothetical protein
VTGLLKKSGARELCLSFPVLTEPSTIHDLRAKSAGDEALGRLAVVVFSLGGET